MPSTARKIAVHLHSRPSPPHPLNSRPRPLFATVHSLVNACPVVHVSFTTPDEPYPVILPMIGQMGAFPTPASPSLDQPLACYLHGYVSSRVMRLSADAGGIPVCICATKLDGLVLALTPFNHSYNYRSAVLFGRARVVEDAAEKLYAMRLITDAVVPGRWDASRTPPDNAEMTSTRILRVEVDSASAKVRSGQAHDERKDMKREDVLDGVWTGVVPVWEHYGEPLPSDYNRVKKVPGYLGGFVKEVNKQSEGAAREAAKDK